MNLSFEYIRGLIDGEGCFTFYTSTTPNGTKLKIPAFSLRMSIRDRQLIEDVKTTLKLTGKVYTYHYPYNYPSRSISKRQPQAILTVRDFGELRNIIIPVFYKSLHGYKRTQYEIWLENMATDPLVPNDYKLLAKLYKNGYFEEKAKQYQ